MLGCDVISSATFAVNENVILVLVNNKTWLLLHRLISSFKLLKSIGGPVS